MRWWAESIAQLAEWSPNLHQEMGSGVVVHTCNPSNGEIKAEGFEIRDHPHQVRGQFELYGTLSLK